MPPSSPECDLHVPSSDHLTVGERQCLNKEASVLSGPMSSVGEGGYRCRAPGHLWVREGTGGCGELCPPGLDRDWAGWTRRKARGTSDSLRRGSGQVRCESEARRVKAQRRYRYTRADMTHNVTVWRTRRTVSPLTRGQTRHQGAPTPAADTDSDLRQRWHADIISNCTPAAPHAAVSRPASPSLCTPARTREDASSSAPRVEEADDRQPPRQHVSCQVKATCRLHAGDTRHALPLVAAPVCGWRATGQSVAPRSQLCTAEGREMDSDRSAPAVCLCSWQWLTKLQLPRLCSEWKIDYGVEGWHIAVEIGEKALLMPVVRKKVNKWWCTLFYF